MRRIFALVAVVVAMMVWVVVQRDASPASSNGGVSAIGSDAAASAPTSVATSGSERNAGASPKAGPRVPNQGDAAQSSPGNSGRGFRDRKHLDEHFTKHGGEFAGLNKAQYLAMAQTLRDAPVGGNILEIIRASDGVASRFDRGSGAFLAFDRDGTIRTFFKPNDGEKYFRRQANRAPAP